MRTILHFSEFQSLESAWRGIRDLIFSEEYDEQYQSFYLVDAGKRAVMESASGDMGFFESLAKHIKNTDLESYNVLVGNYEFDSDDADIMALNAISAFAESLACQFISSASDKLVGASAESLWQSFRQTPQSKNVVLSYPRVLMRIPYGEKQEEVDAFDFEEFAIAHEHNKLLWGSSAFACARLLIRLHHSQAVTDNTISELPAFVYSQDNENILYPCAEFLLTEKQRMDIHKNGFMVFASYRNKNSISLIGNSMRPVSI